MRYTEKPRIKGNRGKLSLTNRVPSAITDIVDGGLFAFREFVLPFHSGAGFALVIHGILIQLNKFLFPECQRCLRIPLLNQMLYSFIWRDRKYKSSLCSIFKSLTIPDRKSFPVRLCISCGQSQRISRNCPLYKTGERTHQPWEVQFAQIRHIHLQHRAVGLKAGISPGRDVVQKLLIAFSCGGF